MLGNMSQPLFITTAIDYTNGAPHIGHAYEKVLADAISDYLGYHPQSKLANKKVLSKLKVLFF